MEPVSPEPLILLRITIHSLAGWIKQQVAHCNVRFWHTAVLGKLKDCNERKTDMVSRFKAQNRVALTPECSEKQR